MTRNNNSAKTRTNPVPKGFLVLVGGNEDKDNDLQILRTIKSLANKDKVRIEVITTASEFPEKTGELYMRTFEKVGGCSVGLLHLTSREDVNDSSLLQRVKEADVIFFSGGDQLRITSVLGGSPIISEIKRKYIEEFCIIAGTSAGASAMSETMIYDGESSEALLKGTVQITGGIGLIDSVIIDTHFVTRGRFSRLMQMVCMNPGYVGIGLGEDTGIIIKDGHIFKAIGNGLIVIMEGLNLKYTNITHINNGDAIAIENMTIHTVVSDHGYDLFERKYLKPVELKSIF